MAQICCRKSKPFWLFSLTGVLFYVLLCRCVPAYCQEQLRLPLTKFNAPGIVKLTANDDAYSLKIPMPKRWQVEGATLQLAYVNSTALLASRSRLVILFNDYPLGQVTLEPAAPEGLVTVSIPARLFEVGYNDLKIRVAQNFKGEGCIPVNPPEVWTSLQLIDSTLELSFTQKEVPLSLASVADFLFDPKISGKNQVHIVTETMDGNDVSLATIAAAAVALRFDYRSVQFSAGHELSPGRDNIIIGSRSFLQKITPDVDPQGDLGVLPMPGEKDTPDRVHGLIYLSGDDAKEIELSVNAFSIISLPLPNVQSCQITDVQLPIVTRYSGKNRLAPEKRYTLQELGLNTTTFRGDQSAPRSIQFILPTQFLLEGNRDILLRLDFAYAASMREDSVLSLDVNGKFVASIPLASPTGGQYKGYTIRLPLSYLTPGRNVLQFSPVLTPLRTTACEALRTEHLALTLFDTSSIQVPKLLQWVKLPQLSYLFNDGFPLTAAPDFAQTTLILPQRDGKSLAAALNFIAGISRKTGILPYQLGVTDTVSATETRNILMVGPRAALPEDIISGSPLAKGISMPVHGRLPGSLRVEDWKDKLRELLFEETIELDPVTPDIAILGTDLRVRPQQALLFAYESPFTPMKTVVVLTAEDSGDLLQASLHLQENEVAQQCREGFVVIDFDGRKPVVQSAALTPSYSVGEITSRNRLSYLIDKYRWPFVGLLVGLLVMLSLGITMLLKKRRRKRLQTAIREEE